MKALQPGMHPFTAEQLTGSLASWEGNVGSNRQSVLVKAVYIHRHRRFVKFGVLKRPVSDTGSPQNEHTLTHNSLQDMYADNSVPTIHYSYMYADSSVPTIHCRTCTQTVLFPQFFAGHVRRQLCSHNSLQLHVRRQFCSHN